MVSLIDYGGFYCSPKALSERQETDNYKAQSSGSGDQGLGIGV